MLIIIVKRKEYSEFYLFMQIILERHFFVSYSFENQTQFAYLQQQKQKKEETKYGILLSQPFSATLIQTTRISLQCKYVEPIKQFCLHLQIICILY